MSSKKLTLNADNSVTVTDPTLADVATSLIDSNVALTGAYGLLQKGLLAFAGASAQNYRLTGSLNPFKAA